MLMRVRATDLPVPLPDGRSVLPASAEPEGMLVTGDLYIKRRIAAGELEVLPEPAVPADTAQEG